MRNPSTAFYEALEGAGENGLIVPMFLHLKAKTRDATPQPFEVGFWTGDDDVIVQLVDGQTGELVTRTYYGVGTSMRVPNIPRVSDLSIQTLQVRLSQLNPIVKNTVRGANVRFAKADIHEGIISPETGTLVSAPEITFLGEVDGDPIDTPAAGEEGGITLEIVSDAIRSLTRVNPSRRSHATQSRRNDDQFAKYSTLTENMEVPWGEKSANKGSKSQGIFGNAKR